MKNLFLLFNHQLTSTQKQDAKSSLKVGEIISPPPDISTLWAQLPPGAETLAPLLAHVQQWLQSHSTVGDFVLIQGDFGATFLMVEFSREQGLVPVYSTTERRAVEEHCEDGSVRMSHKFHHVRFRRYGL